jgi:hypothetical protein
MVLNQRLWWKVALGLALLCTFGVGSAPADSIQYSLSQSNLGNTGPFGTVTVSLDSTKTIATITFASNTNAGNIYLFGGDHAVAVNVNATSYSVSTPTSGWANAGTGFSAPSSISDSGSKNVNGFGTLSDVIKFSDGFTNAADTYQFTVTNTGGTWTNAGNVLINNSSGVALAAHIFVTTSPANQANGASVTGDAANNGGGPSMPPSPLPEPTSLVLMAGLLGGLGVFGVRRSARRQLAA